MKLNITKEEYEGLGEAIQGEYKEDGEGYTLNVEGIEDTGALKRAKDHEKEARKQAEKKARETEDQLKALQTQLDEMKDAGSRKAGDVEALEKSYKDKLAKLESDSQQETQKLLGALKRNTVDATARQLASELSGDNADIILPHIRSRLGFEMSEGGDPAVRVLGDDGSPTADSIDDLKNFYFTNQKFAPIVIGSKASGGGAAGANGRGGAAKKLSDMTATEEAQFANSNPDKYKQMLAAEGR